MTLQQIIYDRLCSGSLLTIVEDYDEALVIAACELASKALPGGRVQTISITAPDFLEQLSAHKKDGAGVLIVPDALDALGSSKQFTRLVREYATMPKATPPYPRIILVEHPGVVIPSTLKSDMEFIRNPLPTLAELLQELEAFLKEHKITLEGNGETKHALAQALSGLPRNEAARLLARCWKENDHKLTAVWLSKAKATRITERSQGALSFVDTSGAADVGGLENLRAWLGEKVKAFGSKKAADFGLPELKGLMLAGVPGCGKSLFAKNAARILGVPLLRLDASLLFQPHVGETEAMVDQVIKAAEACSPCCLWMDEVEKALAGSSGPSGDSGVSKRMFGSILTWLSEKLKPVFIIATANQMDAIQPEFYRKGRFDEVFFVDLPSKEEREAIAKIHVEKKKRKTSDVDPKAIAEVTDGFSGSEIEQAIVDGLFAAFAADRDLTTQDVLDAVGRTNPLSKMMAPQINALREWAKSRQAKMAGKGEAPKVDVPPKEGIAIRKVVDLKGIEKKEGDK